MTNYNIKPKILYVDDEPINLRLFKISFSDNYETTTANSGEEALELIQKKKLNFHIVISDQRMGGMSGTEFMIEAKKILPQSKYILLTGYTDIEALEKAINEVGLWQFVKKPWEPSNLKFIIDNAYKSLVTEEENIVISKALTKSEERLNLALEGTEAGVWDWDLTTNEMYYSPTWKKMLGYENDELENNLKTWEKLLHQDDLQYTFSHLDKYIKGKANTYEVEFRLQHKLGHYVHILSRARGIKDNDDNIIRLTGTNIDLTDKIRAQQQIKQLNEELEARVERRTHALKMLNIQLIQKNKFEHLISKISSELLATKNSELINQINASLKDIINFTKADLSFILRIKQNIINIESEQSNNNSNYSIFDLFSQKSILDFNLLNSELEKGNSIAVKNIESIDDQYIKEKKSFIKNGIKSFLIIPLKYKGELIGCFGLIFYSTYKDWNNEDNNLLKFIGEIFTNAFERYEGEQELIKRDIEISEANKIISENEKRTKLLKSIASIANSPIKLQEALTLSLDILHENGQSYESILVNDHGNVEYHINNSNQQKILKEDLIKEFSNNKSVQVGSLQNHEVISIPLVVQQDLKYNFIFALPSSSPLLNDDSILKEISRELSFVVERDITKNELKKSIEKEKELIELKSQFISMASHQFRTPLTVIQSNIELFQMLAEKSDSALKGKFQTISSRIQEEVSRLGDLMNDVLLLGKLNSSALNANIKEDDIIEVVQNEVRKINSIQKDERIANILIEGNPKKINFDRKLMTHTFTNLLENAFKYSPQAEPPLVNLIFNPNNFVLKVTDYGRGIPEDEIGNLFQPFYRANNIQDIEGTGLGLVVCKKYVELQGGTLEVESSENEKTTFTLTLPNYE